MATIIAHRNGKRQWKALFSTVIQDKESYYNLYESKENTENEAAGIKGKDYCKIKMETMVWNTRTQRGQKDRVIKV